jgi:hypothetical protein
MFNNLCDEVASEKWRGKGKRVDDELYTKLITLHNYLKHHYDEILDEQDVYPVQESLIH